MHSVTPSLATPNMDRIAKEGVLFKWGYTSTPTCTPARAAILTGQKPWNHGSLGAVAVAKSYPFEMPTTLAALGYSTTSIGKDHFGWVNGPDGDVSFDGPDADTCVGGDYDDDGGGSDAEPAGDEDLPAQHADGGAKSASGQGFPPPWGPDLGHGVPHGYQQTSLYDGIVAEGDDYHQWCAAWQSPSPTRASRSACATTPYAWPPLQVCAPDGRQAAGDGLAEARHEQLARRGLCLRQRVAASNGLGRAAGCRLHHRPRVLHHRPGLQGGPLVSQGLVRSHQPPPSPCAPV